MGKCKSIVSDEKKDLILPLKDSPGQFSEIKGFLCGFICSGIESEGKSWLEHLSGNLRTFDGDMFVERHILIDLYKCLSDRMQSETFQLDLNWSQTALPLGIRTYALKKWCHGFLNGLQQAGMPIQETTSSKDLLKMLESFTHLSSVGLEKSDNHEEDEVLFSEVTKCIELAVTQIYRILNHVKARH